MSSTDKIISIAAAKTAAKQLRLSATEQNMKISHSRALEMVAKSEGFRDWNTFSAYLNENPTFPFQENDRVLATYMGHQMAATILSVSELSNSRYQVTLYLDQPVDVVSFDSFSAFRQRVTGVVNQQGISFDKRSDGTPHLTMAPL